jgi:hypothetical protein
MLPDFDENGYLPPGIHRCSIQEVAARFGRGSPERKVETQELVEFVEWAVRAGVRRLLVNGSYVTAAAAPNDVDIVILPGPDYPVHQKSATDRQLQWPFLQVLIAVDDDDFEMWGREDFGTDRNRITKGVVEVIL